MENETAREVTLLVNKSIGLVGRYFPLLPDSITIKFEPKANFAEAIALDRKCFTDFFGETLKEFFWDGPKFVRALYYYRTEVLGVRHEDAFNDPVNEFTIDGVRIRAGLVDGHFCAPISFDAAVILLVADHLKRSSLDEMIDNLLSDIEKDVRGLSKQETTQH